MLRTLGLWLVGLGFGSEFPGSQCKAANRINFSISSVYKSMHDANPE